MADSLEQLLTAVLLDPAVCAQTLAEQRQIAPGDLKAAVAEAIAVMHERGRSQFELQPFLADGDPVMALTIAERIALALSVRLRKSDAEIAELTSRSEKAAHKLVRHARRELARAAIAMGLLTNPTRCPVMQQHLSEGTVLHRARALLLVSHAAECQICVEVMRKIDQQIVQDYAVAVVQLPPLESVDVDLVLARRAARPAISSRRIPSTERLLRYAFWFGAVSSAMILLALFAFRG